MQEEEEESAEAASLVTNDVQMTARASGRSRINQAGGDLLVSGGLLDVGTLLASVAASGVVGNAAYDALKLGLRHLRLRLSRGSEEDQRRFVAHIAQLSVASKLNKPVSVKVASCLRESRHWSAVVRADGRTYRVQIPLTDPRPTAISIDLD